MAKIVYNANQVKFGGKGYLDAKMQPVSTVNDLPSEVTEIFNGLSVVVLSDDEGKQSEYWRVNGQWVKKTTGGSGGTYSAGQYIDITGNEISVTGITPDNYATKTELNEEVSARTEAIAELAGQIQGFVTTEKLDEEVTARTSADEILGDRIGDVQEDVNNLSNAIENEATARTAADEAINEALAEEASARTELAVAVTTETQERIDADLEIISRFTEYPTAAEVSTAITASAEETKAWVEEQGYASQNDIADMATKTWIAEEGFVKENEVTSAITEAKQETFDAAVVWVEGQGYLKDVPGGYATMDDVTTAMTSAVATANAYTDSAVSGIVVPSYTISSATPDQGFASAYELKKDGQSISGSTKINIPSLNGAAIQSPITTDVAVGHVSAGTTFSAGTTIEAILRAILVSDTPTTAGYAYYGALATPLSENELTEANITTLLTRSASAASTTPWTFRVNNGMHQIIIAVPDTFELDEAQDVTNSISYYEEFFNTTTPVSPKRVTINDIPYLVYNVAYGVEFSRFNMEITLINA